MARKSRKNVGLIGLGIIGSRAAAALRASGLHVFVWNRTPQPAPNFLGSPAAVAEVCDLIQIFVADGAALFDIIEAFGDKLTAQHVIICSATVGLEATREAARRVQAKGARFLDAPFTGSKKAAEERQLVYYIGGDEATFLRAKPMLEATSKAIVQIGEIGQAAVVKLATNMIAAVSIQTLAEALALSRAAGVDPAVFAAALERNACRSGTMELKLPKMVSGDFEPHFSLKHMFKDVQLGIHLANALNVELPATTVTAGVMHRALNRGWGDLDFAAVCKTYEDAAAHATEEHEPSESAEPEAATTSNEREGGCSTAAAAGPAQSIAEGELEPGNRPTSEEPGKGEEPAARPFNRIKRFFSPHGG